VKYGHEARHSSRRKPDYLLKVYSSSGLWVELQVNTTPLITSRLLLARRLTNSHGLEIRAPDVSGEANERYSFGIWALEVGRRLVARKSCHVGSGYGGESLNEVLKEAAFPFRRIEVPS
jgi:hypothetical protein